MPLLEEEGVKWGEDPAFEKQCSSIFFHISFWRLLMVQMCSLENPSFPLEKLGYTAEVLMHCICAHRAQLHDFARRTWQPAYPVLQYEPFVRRFPSSSFMFALRSCFLPRYWSSCGTLSRLPPSCHPTIPIFPEQLNSNSQFSIIF
jgi:hypothetical protein